MSTVSVSVVPLSDEDDEIEIIETQNLLDNPERPPNRDTPKSFNQLQCPICFDDVKRATVTSCGHVFCLDCLQQSISSSTARGQIKGRLGVGLCPLCRKKVVFKETTLLRMKIAVQTDLPELPPKNDASEEV